MTNTDQNARQEWHCKCGKINCRPAHLGKPVGWKVIETDGDQQLLCGDCALLASIGSNSKEITDADAGKKSCKVKPGINANIFLRLGISIDLSNPNNARLSINHADFLGAQGEAA